jgi:hypothetical protein
MASTHKRLKPIIGEHPAISLPTTSVGEPSHKGLSLTSFQHDLGPGCSPYLRWSAC